MLERLKSLIFKSKNTEEDNFKDTFKENVKTKSSSKPPIRKSSGDNTKNVLDNFGPDARAKFEEEATKQAMQFLRADKDTSDVGALLKEAKKQAKANHNEEEIKRLEAIEKTLRSTKPQKKVDDAQVVSAVKPEEKTPPTAIEPIVASPTVESDPPPPENLTNDQMAWRDLTNWDDPKTKALFSEDKLSKIPTDIPDSVPPVVSMNSAGASTDVPLVVTTNSATADPDVLPPTTDNIGASANSKEARPTSVSTNIPKIFKLIKNIFSNEPKAKQDPTNEDLMGTPSSANVSPNSMSPVSKKGEPTVVIHRNTGRLANELLEGAPPVPQDEIAVSDQDGPPTLQDEIVKGGGMASKVGKTHEPREQKSVVMLPNVPTDPPTAKIEQTPQSATDIPTKTINSDDPNVIGAGAMPTATDAANVVTSNTPDTSIKEQKSGLVTRTLRSLFTSSTSSNKSQKSPKNEPASTSTADIKAQLESAKPKSNSVSGKKAVVTSIEEDLTVEEPTEAAIDLSIGSPTGLVEGANVDIINPSQQQDKKSPSEPIELFTKEGFYTKTSLPDEKFVYKMKGKPLSQGHTQVNLMQMVKNAFKTGKFNDVFSISTKNEDTIADIICIINTLEPGYRGKIYFPGFEGSLDHAITHIMEFPKIKAVVGSNATIADMTLPATEVKLKEFKNTFNKYKNEDVVEPSDSRPTV